MKRFHTLPTLATALPIVAVAFPLLFLFLPRHTKFFQRLELSQRAYYYTNYPPHGRFTDSSRALLPAILRTALANDTLRNRVHITHGITSEARLAQGYVHDDVPGTQFCPPTNTPNRKIPCLTILTNAYFGPAGTAVHPETNTVYELGGGCCIHQWRLYLNKTVTLPQERRYEGKIVLVLNGHHSITYHHVFHDVMPRFLIFVRLLEAFPDILVAVDHGHLALQIFSLLGFPRDRLIIMDGPHEHWFFASVLLYPPSVFGHSNIWFGDNTTLATARVVASSVKRSYHKRNLLVLLERARTRKEDGSCSDTRCARNFHGLHQRLQETFKDVLQVVVYRADASVKTGVSLFSRARFVVGVHGGGFQNIMFCEPNTVVVHIGWGPDYKPLADLFQLKFYLSEMKSLTRDTRNVRLNLDQVIKDVEHAARVEQVLNFSETTY